MKTLFTTVLAICFVTALANSQTIKVIGGVDLMRVKTVLKTLTNTNDEADTTENDNTNLSKKFVLLNNKDNNENQLVEAAKNITNNTGFYIGLVLSDVQLFNNIVVQPELRFVAVKDFSQIQVPVLVTYKVSDKWKAYTGPNFEFLIDVAHNIKSFNFALDFGVSYQVFNKIAFDARYDWGQTNLLKHGDANNYIKINNIQFGVVYQFGN